jgi:hypothetical protein
MSEAHLHPQSYYTPPVTEEGRAAEQAKYDALAARAAAAVAQHPAVVAKERAERERLEAEQIERSDPREELRQVLEHQHQRALVRVDKIDALQRAKAHLETAQHAVDQATRVMTGIAERAADTLAEAFRQGDVVTPNLHSADPANQHLAAARRALDVAQTAYDAVAVEDQAAQQALREAVEDAGRIAARVLEKELHERASRAEALLAEVAALKREVAGGARCLSDAAKRYGWARPALSAAVVRVSGADVGEGTNARWSALLSALRRDPEAALPSEG